MNSLKEAWRLSGLELFFRRQHDIHLYRQVKTAALTFQPDLVTVFASLRVLPEIVRISYDRPGIEIVNTIIADRICDLMLENGDTRESLIKELAKLSPAQQGFFTRILCQHGGQGVYRQDYLPPIVASFWTSYRGYSRDENDFLDQLRQIQAPARIIAQFPESVKRVMIPVNNL